MAHNVISCRKVAENNKITKFAVNLASDLENHPKNGSLNRDLLKFFNRYGIFWVPPGESSCPDGSEYVWQRGVESLQGQVTAAQS